MSKRRGNGEGSIWEDKKRNRWIGQYTANGKRKTIYAKSRQEIQAKIQKKLVSIKENKYIDKSKLTINDVMEIMLEEIEKANIVSENTLLRKKKARRNNLKNVYSKYANTTSKPSTDKRLSARPSKLFKFVHLKNSYATSEHL